MEHGEQEMMRGLRAAGCAMAGVLFLTLAACSSEQPKPLAQPTPDQVRGHADRAFEKLKQEEQGRTAQPPAQGY
jgi:hypothetical protein